MTYTCCNQTFLALACEVRGKVILSVCLFTGENAEGGGTPVSCAMSLLGGGGYTSVCAPMSIRGKGVPVERTGIHPPLRPRGQDRGTALSTPPQSVATGQDNGTPPLPLSGNRWTLHDAGGMPLAVTQEDFLVNLFNVNSAFDKQKSGYTVMEYMSLNYRSDLGSVYCSFSSKDVVRINVHNYH